MFETFTFRALSIGVAAVVVVGCSGMIEDQAATAEEGQGAAGPDDDKGDLVGPEADAAAELRLDPLQGTYAQACDGSGGVALDFDHFLDLTDEEQGVRVYARAAGGAPVHAVDVSGELGLAPRDEVDLEDAARVGDRVYVVASHGRNKSGARRPERARFFALDVAGAAPGVTLTVAGSSASLLVDLLDAARWDVPDEAVIAALRASSQPTIETALELAPWTAWAFAGWPGRTLTTGS